MSSKPSEMEGAVLGVIQEEGPLTVYAVRKRFLASPSPQWSGSAGAIYPLVERLEKRGWIRSRAQTTSNRKGRLYSLTPAGLKQLAAWLAPPLEPHVLGVPPDPLRTRLSFLWHLSPHERREFVDEALTGNQIQIERVRADLKAASKAPEPWRRLVARGALASLRARRGWLREVRKSLGGRGRKGQKPPKS